MLNLVQLMTRSPSWDSMMMTAIAPCCGYMLELHSAVLYYYARVIIGNKR
jgi:hypothetical protein